MGILNKTNDGNHSVLTALFKTLAREKSLPEQRLVNYCAPGSAVDSSMVRSTQLRWTQLGLFAVDDKGNCSLNSEAVAKSERNVEALPHLVRRLALGPNNNADLWAKEQAGAADFTRLLCWTLAQDAWASEFSGWESGVNAVLDAQLPDEVEASQNGTRWPGLKPWAEFMGFLWGTRFPSKNHIAIDPTAAIRAVLPEVFGDQPELSARAFVDQLAEILPVLDGGVYRKNVEEKLTKYNQPESWRPPPDHQISTSLSRAILRLRADRTLLGEKRADTPAGDRIVLSLRGNQPGEEFSHFTFSAKR